MAKIIFYTDTPIYGGAERHMTLLARNLIRNGDQVTIIFSGFKQLNSWQEELKKTGIPTIRLKVSHKHDPRHFLQLKKIFNKEKPEILHLHLWNPASCRYAFFAADKKNTRIVATEHDPFPIKGFRKSIKNKCLKKTDHVIAVSNANKEYLIKEYPELKNKISVVHNGIDLESFEKELIHFTAQEKYKIRHILFNAGNNDFIIISIAALHARKGLKYLIEAYKQALNEIPNSKLVVIGEGPQEKELKKLIKSLEIFNNVVLLGFQKNIPGILKSSDLFVLPSIKEAFGLVLLEAMACQLPIIASEVGGIPEIIHNHKNGELVKAASSKELAAKIIELYKNTAQREKIAFLGNHYVKNFDAKEMARKTEQIYHKVLSVIPHET